MSAGDEDKGASSNAKRPPATLSHSGCVTASFQSLHHFAQKFQAALILLENIEKHWNDDFSALDIVLKTKLYEVPIRDAVMNAHNFYMAVEVMNTQFRFCEDKFSAEDFIKSRALIGDALKTFKERFKNIKVVRHSIGHAGEIYGSPDEFQKHIQKEDYTSEYVFSAAGGGTIEAITGRVYTAGFKGKTAHVIVDLASLVVLVEIIKSLEPIASAISLQWK